MIAVESTDSASFSMPFDIALEVLLRLCKALSIGVAAAGSFILSNCCLSSLLHMPKSKSVGSVDAGVSASTFVACAAAAFSFDM